MQDNTPQLKMVHTNGTSYMGQHCVVVVGSRSPANATFCDIVLQPAGHMKSGGYLCPSNSTESVATGGKRFKFWCPHVSVGYNPQDTGVRRGGRSRRWSGYLVRPDMRSTR